MICVSISRFQQLEQVLDSGAGFLELRLDLIRRDPEGIFALLPEAVKTLVTCRPGVYSESESQQLLKTSMDLLAAHARQRGTTLIISYHNFELTPQQEELQVLLKSCYERGGDLAKIAVQVDSTEDVRRLLDLYRLPGKKVILGMGKQGRITRVMGPYLGGEFTFAAPGEGRETAPGQLSYHQLEAIYKVIDIS